MTIEVPASATVHQKLFEVVTPVTGVTVTMDREYIESSVFHKVEYTVTNATGSSIDSELRIRYFVDFSFPFWRNDD